MPAAPPPVVNLFPAMVVFLTTAVPSEIKSPPPSKGLMLSKIAPSTMVSWPRFMIPPTLRPKFPLIRERLIVRSALLPIAPPPGA